MSWLLIAAVLLPGAATMAGKLARTPSGAQRVIARATAAGFGCAVALTVLVVAGGPATAAVTASGDEVLIGLRADRITVVLLTLTLGISGIVQAFALRSLLGDARARRFALLAGAITSTAAATAAAATVLGLAVAWSLTSLALCALIALYRGYDQAEEGVRRTGAALAIGDAALWVAVAILTIEFGSIELGTLSAAAPTLDAPTALIVGLLVLTAAAARSVQVPFHRWLPATLASPTPVSALLHAGVVNAGAVLLLLLAPIVTQSAITMHAAVLVGALTAAVGIPLMLTRPDIKGALAQSTVAQMGFMIMTCGFGLWAAAILHLAAHGAYKAARFLGSGAAVTQVGVHRAAAHAHRALSWRTSLAALVVAAAPIAVAAALLPIPGGGALLLGFAWATLAMAGRGWLATHQGRGGLLAFAAASVVIGPGYVIAVEAFAHVLEPALPAPAGPMPSVWLLVPAAALMLTGPAIWAFGRPAWKRRLYVWSLTAGDGSRPPRSRRGTPIQPLVVDVEGSTL